MKTRTLFPQPALDEEMLLAAFDAHDVAPVHARRLWRFLVQRGAASFADVPGLPLKAQALLEAQFAPMSSSVVSRSDAADGSTTKLLIELQDGLRVESVIMRYGDVALASFPDEERSKLSTDQDGNIKFKSNRRATLCVSSQVGCAMGCTFCATGTMGMIANLSAGEIIEQLVHANKIERIRNVVFMGMGEPLDNYQAVLSAVRAMVDTSRFGLSPSRISISTVGVVPRMQALTRDMPDIGLALSLHAPTQDLRAKIVPTAKAWNIHRIMDAADAFITQQNNRIKSNNRRRHILIEYVLIANVNDSMETAHALGALLQGRDVLLNVIPYNPTAVPHNYHPPAPAVTRAFVDTVRTIYGVHTLQRQELGQDISGACGQLVISSSGIDGHAAKPKMDSDASCKSITPDASQSRSSESDRPAAAEHSVPDVEDLGRPANASPNVSSTQPTSTPSKPRSMFSFTAARSTNTASSPLDANAKALRAPRVTELRRRSAAAARRVAESTSLASPSAVSSRSTLSSSSSSATMRVATSTNAILDDVDPPPHIVKGGLQAHVPGIVLVYAIFVLLGVFVVRQVAKIVM